MTAAIFSSLTAWELFLLAFLTAALTAFTGSLLPRLVAAEAPRGIVSLQLARTAGRARTLVDAWTRRGMLGAVRRNVLLDFGFLVAYSSLLAFLSLLVDRGATASGFAPLSTEHVGTAFALAAWSAGSLDAVENMALLGMLEENAHISAARTRTVWAAAVLKFLLIACALGWIVSAPIASLVAEAT